MNHRHRHSHRHPLRVLALLAPLLLAGCASQPPQAAGPYRALNPGRWQPTPEDLQVIRAAPPAQAQAPARP